MAATDTQKKGNPIKTLEQHHELAVTLPPHPTASPKDNNTSSTLLQSPVMDSASPPKDGGNAVDELNVTAGSVTDSQKKIRRAERFGMPIQLSEEEKRNFRAERFGTGSGLHGSDPILKSEDHKRKARAERFGMGQSLTADDEEKKKVRLARFAPVSKTDSVEEDKKKARALRFSSSHGNGKGVEPDTLLARQVEGPENQLLC